MVRLRDRIKSKTSLADCLFALEEPEFCQGILNGQEICMEPVGFHVDKRSRRSGCRKYGRESMNRNGTFDTKKQQAWNRCMCRVSLASGYNTYAMELHLSYNGVADLKEYHFSAIFILGTDDSEKGTKRSPIMEKAIEKIDALLKKPCYIMDFLPERVEPDNGGQFFDVEYYLLNSDKYTGLKDRFVVVILKLMCYYHTAVLWNGWIDRPAPEMIEKAVGEIMENHSGTLNVLFVEQDVLLVFDWDCLNLAIYNPPAEVRFMMERIAGSEGLFWREAAQ